MSDGFDSNTSRGFVSVLELPRGGRPSLRRLQRADTSSHCRVIRTGGRQFFVGNSTRLSDAGEAEEDTRLLTANELLLQATATATAETTV